jgi:Uma2 family endonuclease
MKNSFQLDTQDNRYRNMLYVANGVRLGLLVDRKNRQVHIYRPDRPPEILDAPESVRCDSEMPMFVLEAKIG